MKKKGCQSDFIEERDAELHSRFMDLLRSERGKSLGELYGAAARCKASRFWVSPERAADVLSCIERGVENMERMYLERRRMYEELRRRVAEKREESPERPMMHIVEEVVEQEAPEFYITEKSSKVIICRYVRSRRERRRGCVKIGGVLLRRNNAGEGVSDDD